MPTLARRSRYRGDARSAADAAAQLRKNGYRISVLGVGTETGAPVPGDEGGLLRELHSHADGRSTPLKTAEIPTSVRNAFLAAEEDGPVGMKHLVHAARRELQKIGKVTDESHLAYPPLRRP